MKYIKVYWYVFIVLCNLIFFATNVWKMFFVYHPDGLVFIGAFICLIHLIYFVPMLVRAQESAKRRVYTIDGVP